MTRVTPIFVLVLSAMLAIAVSTPAAASSVHLAVTGMTVIINKGDGHRHHLGQGKNHLDDPTQFTCNSGAGCLVTIQAMVGVLESQSHWKICSLVDGQKAEPKCPVQDEGNPLYRNTGSTLQSIQVSAGQHVVQTKVDVHLEPGGVRPSLVGWEVNYTIYEQ